MLTAKLIRQYYSFARYYVYRNNKYILLSKYKKVITEISCSMTNEKELNKILTAI